MSDEYTPTARIAIADIFAGIVVGSGYGSMTIGIDAAIEAADLILSSEWLAEHDHKVAAKERERCASIAEGAVRIAHDAREVTGFEQARVLIAAAIREGRS